MAFPGAGGVVFTQFLLHLEQIAPASASESPNFCNFCVPESSGEAGAVSVDKQSEEQSNL